MRGSEAQGESREKGERCVELAISQEELLNHPSFNKGSGFTKREREAFDISGHLPNGLSTIEDQVKRCLINFQRQRDNLEKYLFLASLRDRNEVLFFRFASEYPEEVLPCIYTPTIGDVALHYSTLHHRPRGIYLSYPDRAQIDRIVQNIPRDRVDIVLITDGGRVLGLGDLGIGGMAIATGKLTLYTLFGGIDPAYTLPIQLDVGTDNPKLLDDPLYLGWRHTRIRGAEYDAFVDSAIRAIVKRFPHAVIQWEDFAKEHAQPLLQRYREKIRCFNDDIQGTASVVMAGLFAALKSTGQRLGEQRVVLFGAGSAGIGIAQLLALEMQKSGISEKEAKKKIFVLGRDGLAHTRSKKLDPLKRQFAQEYEDIQNWQVEKGEIISLLDVVKQAKPTILIGTSTVPGSFTEEVVLEMNKGVKNPIIFPLSNPTSQSEALPVDLMRWTRGRALIATGSPFPPVEYEGVTRVIGQCNNASIFPGIGLGIHVTRASRITDEMFLTAARVLSEYAPVLRDPQASLFPQCEQLRTISRSIAIAVGNEAIAKGLSPYNSLEVKGAIDAAMWTPKYAHFKRKAG